jgi:hypothetical protein
LSYEAAFLLDAMEALPRKWVSGSLKLVAYPPAREPTGRERVGENRRFF